MSRFYIYLLDELPTARFEWDEAPPTPAQLAKLKPSQHSLAAVVGRLTVALTVKAGRLPNGQWREIMFPEGTQAFFDAYEVILLEGAD